MQHIKEKTADSTMLAVTNGMWLSEIGRITSFEGANSAQTVIALSRCTPSRVERDPFH